MAFSKPEFPYHLYQEEFLSIHIFSPDNSRHNSLYGTTARVLWTARLNYTTHVLWTAGTTVHTYCRK